VESVVRSQYIRIYLDMPSWVLFSLLGVAGLLTLWVVPKMQVARFAMDAATRFDKENEARKTLATVLGGLAIVVTIYSTWATLRMSQEGQITDRYTKAIEELGSSDNSSPRLEVRLGGIYALDRIASDSPRDGLTVDQVLSAYLRRNAAVASTTVNADSSPSSPVRVDFQAIVTILGNRAARKSPGRVEPLNLSNVDLSGVSFADGHFEGFYFNDAVLRGCSFRGAKLGSAHMFGAHLEGVSDLGDADLSGADLRGAVLDDATLAGATLHQAQLQRASFKGANLDGVDFAGANLEDAHFEGVKLVNAKGLCMEQLDNIHRDHGTRLPQNLAPCSK